jgi:hypothetical protein
MGEGKAKQLRNCRSKIRAMTMPPTAEDGREQWVVGNPSSK